MKRAIFLFAVFFVAVSMLCASSLLKGLFHGAISQTSSSFDPTRTTTCAGEQIKPLQQSQWERVEIMTLGWVSSIAKLRNIEAEKPPQGIVSVRSMAYLRWLFAGEGIHEWPSFCNQNPLAMYLKPTACSKPVPDETSRKLPNNCYQWDKTNGEKARDLRLTFKDGRELPIGYCSTQRQYLL